MHKDLSIIIPYYKEEPQDVAPLLWSINNQVGIDFRKIEIILVNDGGDNTLPDSLFEMINIDIDIIFLSNSENKGPGVARQTGLDKAHGEYVLFCDADDILHSVAVLGLFLAQIKENKPDIITTHWLEEVKTEDGMMYLTHTNEATWMHGKVFRQQFLTDNNIKFHPDFRVHEDTYFLALAYAHTQNITRVDIPTYVWKWHDNSITRRDNALYLFSSMPVHVKAVIAGFHELDKHVTEQMYYKVTQYLIYCYFTLHRAEWQADEVADYKREFETILSKEIKPYLHYFYESPQHFINTVYEQERMKSFTGHIESEPFYDWLENMGLSNMTN